jgi:cation diffusion facilitator CzcD-associated flavoprotein CzcO
VTTFTQGIKHVTPKGFVLEDGKEVEVDVLICATGFNTNWVPRFPIIAHGRNVQDVMAESTVSYLAIALPDCEFTLARPFCLKLMICPIVPNYWTGVGTYAALGHGSFVNTIEYVTSHILEIVEKMQKEDIRSLTPRREAANAFVEHADLYLKRLAFSGNCASVSVGMPRVSRNVADLVPCSGTRPARLMAN